MKKEISQNKKNKEPKGVLVASDETLEWMLPWWWYHYKKSNTLPVAFVDFGMSKRAQKWCQERGELIPFDISLDFIVPEEEIAEELKDKWKSIYLVKNFWHARKFWQRKPFAMRLSPFQKTIWTDLDCEIRDSLDPLFDLLTKGFAIVPEPLFSQQMCYIKGMTVKGQRVFNGGVVAYETDHKILEKWTQHIKEQNMLFPGDQNILSNLIFAEKIPINELPEIYNWRMAQGENPNAVIVHWVADWGKEHIKKEIEEKNISFNK